MDHRGYMVSKIYRSEDTGCPKYMDHRGYRESKIYGSQMLVGISIYLSYMAENLYKE